MFVDVHWMYGKSIKPNTVIIVKQKEDPNSIDNFSAKGITFEFKSTENLQESDRRTALDSKKALADIAKDGFHIASADIIIEEK